MIKVVDMNGDVLGKHVILTDICINSKLPGLK